MPSEGCIHTIPGDLADNALRRCRIVGIRIWEVPRVHRSVKSDLLDVTVSVHERDGS